MELGKQLKYLRKATASNSYAAWGFTGGMFAVDERWETLRFGYGLEETEAVALVEALTPYFPVPVVEQHLHSSRTALS